MILRGKTLTILLVVLVCGAVYAVAVFARDRNGQTWLSQAAMYGRNQTVEMLLKLGANVNTIDNLDRTPLHWTACYGHVETVKLLLDHGADINARDDEGNTPIYAATRYTSAEIVKALAEAGADVNVPDKSGATALQWAAIAGHVEMMTILLAHGADVGAANKDGRTALHYAAAILSGYPEPVRLLGDYRAAANVNGRMGNSSLHEAARARGYCEPPKMSGSSSYAAIKSETSKAATPLHLIAVRGKPETAKLLIDHDADINAKDKDGNTPLAVAIETNNSPVADILRKYEGE